MKATQTGSDPILAIGLEKPIMEDCGHVWLEAQRPPTRAYSPRSSYCHVLSTHLHAQFLDVCHHVLCMSGDHDLSDLYIRSGGI